MQPAEEKRLPYWDYIAEGELTVTITLAEYRELTETAERHRALVTAIEDVKKDVSGALQEQLKHLF